MSWVRAAVRSTAECLERALACCLFNIPELIAAQATILAIRRLRPLPKQESSKIGRQEPGRDRSILPGLGIIAISAF